MPTKKTKNAATCLFPYADGDFAKKEVLEARQQCIGHFWLDKDFDQYIVFDSSYRQHVIDIVEENEISTIKKYVKLALKDFSQAKKFAMENDLSVCVFKRTKDGASKNDRKEVFNC